MKSPDTDRSSEGQCSPEWNNLRQNPLRLDGVKWKVVEGRF
jgi:hypothetical protein